MKILYKFKPYAQPKVGIFKQDTNVYAPNGWIKKEVTEQIIGETDDCYITRLAPYTNKFDGPPTCLLPVGFHKTRFVGWQSNQLVLF